jgi:hypothetical protein
MSEIKRVFFVWEGCLLVNEDGESLDGIGFLMMTTGLLMISVGGWM